jgi:hypothetical protein
MMLRLISPRDSKHLTSSNVEKHTRHLEELFGQNLSAKYNVDFLHFKGMVTEIAGKEQADKWCEVLYGLLHPVIDKRWDYEDLKKRPEF